MTLSISLHRIFYIIFACWVINISAYDNPYFFRPRLFPGEPRLMKDHLFSLDVIVAGGHAVTSRNFCHHRVPLLDIYGTQNIQLAGLNLPPQDQTNPFTTLLGELAALPAVDGFAHLSLSGCLRIREAAFDGYYNFCKGWFIHGYLPIRSLEVEGITRRDLSPSDLAPQPNKSNPVWQQVISSFTPLLASYNLFLIPSRSLGLGDLTWLIGWTHNEEQRTTYLDFIDTTLEFGVMFPTSKRAHPNIVFNLPTGYDGHLGFPLIFRASIGAFDWLTFGGSVEGRFFINRTAHVRMKTAEHQQGLIILAEGCARRHLGSILTLDAFAKADHVFKGISFLLGYTYDHQARSTLHPCSSFFNSRIVNSNSALDAWSMHTLHVILDYDFACDSQSWGPRIGIVYNQQLSGKLVTAARALSGIFIGIDAVYSW
jgi:hypothetical protein